MEGAMVLPWVSLVKLGIQSRHEKLEETSSKCPNCQRTNNRVFAYPRPWTTETLFPSRGDIYAESGGMTRSSSRDGKREAIAPCDLSKSRELKSL